MDYDRSIHHNPDAKVWAKFFIETTKDMGREVFNDEGYIVGWFANAMMAMHDHLYTKEIERLREQIKHSTQEHSILVESLDAEIERLRRIIWNLLDDGDETDRAEALAALQQKDSE
jgi:hypothetical protein